MLSTPVSGVATRNATVAPGVAPCLRSPSAVGSTPHEHKGNGAPSIDAQSTDFTLPVPRRRVSNAPGTSTASTPANRKPTRRKREASLRISQVAHRTPIRKPIIVIPLAGWAGTGNGVPVPAGLGRGDAPTAPPTPLLYFGRYFLFNAQATEYWGSTTLAT